MLLLDDEADAFQRYTAVASPQNLGKDRKRYCLVGSLQVERVSHGVEGLWRSKRSSSRFYACKSSPCCCLLVACEATEWCGHVIDNFSSLVEVELFLLPFPPPSSSSHPALFCSGLYIADTRAKESLRCAILNQSYAFANCMSPLTCISLVSTPI